MGEKRYYLLLTLLFLGIFSLLGQTVYSQTDKVVNISLGVEMNMNSRENFAGGVVLGFDYNLPLNYLFATGLTVTGSSNFTGINVLEFLGLFRWYILKGWHEKLFIQADLGVNLPFENDEVKPMFVGGVRGGYRFLFDSSFYLEPYGRFGYPFFFGIGVTAGLSFGGR